MQTHWVVVLDVVGFSGYYGVGQSIAEARKNFRKQAKRFPSGKACWFHIVSALPTKEVPYIDGDMMLRYPVGAKLFDI